MTHDREFEAFPSRGPRARAPRAERRSGAREAEAGALSRLLTVAEALARVEGPDDVLDVLVREASAALGARAALAYLAADDRSLELAASIGHHNANLDPWRRIVIDQQLPVVRAFLTGDPVWLESRDAILAFAPSMQAAIDAIDAHAAVAIQLWAGRPLGALSLQFAEPRRFDPIERALIQGVVRQCAQALDRVRLREAEHERERQLRALLEERDRLLAVERQAKEEAELAGEQLAFLSDASELLFRSLDPKETLTQLARAAVPRFADWCAVDVLDEHGDLQQLAVAHVDPETARWAIDHRERHAPDADAHGGAWSVIRSGAGLLLTEIPPDLIDEVIGEQPGREELLHDPSSLMIVPMIGGGRPLGAITFLWAESDRRYDESDLRLAEDLARRAAIALEHARLFEERRRVADTLQRSLLPPSFLEVPGLDVAARYRPAGDVTQVGGDFYDLFQTDDASWGLVLGDVSGKGAGAAAVMGIARYTVRTAALSERRPSRILGMLNEALLRQTEDQRFCTAVYARIRPGEHDARLTLAVGGHPPPLVVRADGSVEDVAEPGVLIGAFPDVEHDDTALDLGPGDVLVVYSDGVIEERREDGEGFGPARMRELLAACAGAPAREIVERVVREVESFGSGDPHDDVAVVAVRVRPIEEPEVRRVAGEVRVGPRAAADGRKVLDGLAAFVSARVLEDARLLVSELVTNSVRHGGLPEGDPIEIDATIEGPVLHVEVRDRGQGFEPSLPQEDQERESGWGLVLVDRLATRWGVERGGGATFWFDLPIGL